MGKRLFITFGLNLRFIILSFILGLACSPQPTHDSLIPKSYKASRIEPISQTKKIKNPYAKLFATHPASNPIHYDLSENWNHRVYNIDERHIDYATEMNKVDKFTEVPKKTSLFKSISERIQEISDSEPKVLKKLKSKYIYGIYFCEDLGGTGLTGLVYENKKPIGGFIILDAKVLDRNANEWITYKERTVFKGNKKSVNIEIEEPGKNSKAGALEYILLHELGHIVSIVENQVPDFKEEFREYDSFSFTKEDWSENNEESNNASHSDLKEIKFYSSKKIPIENSLSIYQSLKTSPFPTLYAATNADDHFAESFVSYVHVFLYKKPWKLIISENEKPIFEMGNGIREQRCAKEKETIAQIFKKFE